MYWEIKGRKWFYGGLVWFGWDGLRSLGLGILVEGSKN